MQKIIDTIKVGKYLSLYYTKEKVFRDFYKHYTFIEIFSICYEYNQGTIIRNSRNQGHNKTSGNANFGDEEQKDRKLFNFYDHFYQFSTIS